MTDRTIELVSVWCVQCGRTEMTDDADGRRWGYPECCGETMHPEAEQPLPAVSQPDGGMQP